VLPERIDGGEGTLLAMVATPPPAPPQAVPIGCRPGPVEGPD
jgi:hypothetical protein